MRAPSGLRPRLAIALGVAAVPVIVVLAWANHQLQAEAVAGARTDVAKVAEFVAEQEAVRLQGARMLLETLDETPGMVDVPTCEGIVRSLVQDTAGKGLEIAAVATTDLDGRVLCQYPPPEAGASLAGEAAFTRSLQRDDFASGYYSRAGDGTPVVRGAHPVHDAVRRPVAVALVTLRLGWLPEAFHDGGAPPEGRLAVVGPDGRILVRYPDPEGLAGTSATNGAIIDALRASPDGRGVVEATGLDAKDRLFGFAALGEQRGDGYIVYSVETATVTAPAQAVFRGALAAAVGGVGLALLIAWLTTNRLVVRPVRSLSDATRRMAAGDLGIRVGGDLPGEVGDLARSFDDMAGALQHSSNKLRHDSMHDALTGLANRPLLADRFALLSAACARDGTPFAVLFVDLDRFKPINDRHGHRAGDAVLVGMADRLRRLVRPTDTVARLAGDEFVVCLAGRPGHDLGAVAAEVAERVRQAAATPFLVGDTTLEVSASIGVAVRTTPGTLDDVLHEADLAMYDAKQAGGDRIVRLDSARLAQADSRTRIEAGVRAATSTGEGLSVRYQPIVDLRTGDPVGVEVLARLQLDGRAVPPDEFIAVAERAGYIAAVDDWVLRRALTELAEAWPAALLSVNASALELQPGFAGRITAALAAHGWEPDRLIIEVTETALADPSIASAALAPLRDRGIGVAVDDFGTGYASLSQLRHLPVTAVKVDRSFVTDIATDRSCTALVSAVVAIADSLGLGVIAEGVETPAHLAAITKLGCHHAQGYYFAQPMTAAALADLVARRWPAG